MDILKIIYKNCIIYKMFLTLLVMYKNSYLKKVNDFFVNIYRNSNFSLKVQKYFNSTPLYKYSLIKKMNEKIYLFVVNHSKWLYDLVFKTFVNSFFVIFLSKKANELKNDKLRSVTLFLALFFASVTLTRAFIIKDENYFIFQIISLFFVIVCLLSSFIKKTVYNSYFYNLVVNMLKVEVSNE